MDRIKIGEHDLAVTRPEDFDTKLVAMTGCAAKEHAAMLRHVATPYGVARVLWQLLGDPGDLTVATLAEAIAENGTGAVAGHLVTLLASDESAPPAPVPGDDQAGG